MDCVVNNNNFFSSDINCYLIRKMEVLTDKLLPIILNPFLFQSGFGKNSGIMNKRLKTIVKPVLFRSTVS